MKTTKIASFKRGIHRGTKCILVSPESYYENIDGDIEITPDGNEKHLGSEVIVDTDISDRLVGLMNKAELARYKLLAKYYKHQAAET